MSSNDSAEEKKRKERELRRKIRDGHSLTNKEALDIEELLDDARQQASDLAGQLFGAKRPESERQKAPARRTCPHYRDSDLEKCPCY